MINNVLTVFSIIRKIEIFVKGVRKNKCKEISLVTLIDDKKDVSWIVNFKKTKKFYAENSKRLANDISNGYYSFNDLASFLLYKYLMGEKTINLYNIRSNQIIEFKKMFTKKRHKQDLELLKNVAKQTNLKSIKDFFEIKEDGTNIAYVLTIRGKISPIFFIKNFKKFLTKQKENVIIKENNEYNQFVIIASKLKETLKGGSNAN